MKHRKNHHHQAQQSEEKNKNNNKAKIPKNYEEPNHQISSPQEISPEEKVSSAQTVKSQVIHILNHRYHNIIKKIRRWLLLP